MRRGVDISFISLSFPSVNTACIWPLTLCYYSHSAQPFSENFVERTTCCHWGSSLPRFDMSLVILLQIVNANAIFTWSSKPREDKTFAKI